MLLDHPLTSLLLAMSIGQFFWSVGTGRWLLALASACLVVSNVHILELKAWVSVLKAACP